MSTSQIVDATIDLMGRPATCKVTGYAGVITSVSFDLYGCIQAGLTPPASMKEKVEYNQGHWFDVNRLTVDRDAKRVMPVPAFDFYKTDKPAEYAHGAADKGPPA